MILTVASTALILLVILITTARPSCSQSSYNYDNHHHACSHRSCRLWRIVVASVSMHAGEDSGRGSSSRSSSSSSSSSSSKSHISSRNRRKSQSSTCGSFEGQTILRASLSLLTEGTTIHSDCSSRINTITISDSVWGAAIKMQLRALTVTPCYNTAAHSQHARRLRPRIPLALFYHSDAGATALIRTGESASISVPYDRDGMFRVPWPLNH